MSEEEQNKLAEYVFRDIRVLEKPRKNSYLETVKDELARINNPVEKVENYQFIMSDNKNPHAERWSIALNSYKNYPCFRSDDYYIESKFLCYKKGGKRIRITADILTGPSEIIKSARRLGLYNHDSLKSFCRVAYTIGNVCPVMKNPGGKAGSDTCWYKLENYHDTTKHKLINGTEIEYWNNNISRRDAKNMFAVFPDKLSGREIVSRLMLNDYYDDNYNLIINKTPQEYAALGVDEYINFIQLVTTLIIKRGKRIYYSLISLQ